MTQKNQHGFSMIEILISIVVILIGLLGLVGLHINLQKSEFESYQRTQAITILNDMVNRIELNRINAEDYVTTSPIGLTGSCTSTGTNRVDQDKFQWCNLIVGASESLAGQRVGTLLEGGGCVEATANGEFMVTVIWQGISQLAPPPTSVDCGCDTLDCTLRTRRAVTARVLIGELK